MIEIIKSDCMEGLRTIQDSTVDLVVTSPPYNKLGLRKGKKEHYHDWSAGNNIQYITYDDNMDEQEYQRWQVEVMNEIYRILKPTGSLFYNHKIRRYKGTAYFPQWVFDSKLKFYQQIVWNRKTVSDWNVNYLNPTTELIFWMVKEKPKVFKKRAMFTGEIWDIVPKKTKHPAPFPEELAENCILLTTQENDLVIDPFSGSGTTAKMAMLNNRRFIGFDISEEYCKMAENRLKEEKCQLAFDVSM